MTRMTNTQCEELPSEIFLVGINKCNEMLQFISTMNETIKQLITNLNKAVEDAETLRRNVLIAKTTGVAAASVGTTLSVVGLILIPFTAGISVPILCGTGTALAVSGSLTNLGTTLAAIPINNNQCENITDLLDNFEQSHKKYSVNTEELNETLGQCDLSEFQYMGEFFKRQRELDITKWLNAGRLHKDEDVNINDLRKGDHIYTTGVTSPIHKHHGIYINDDMVVELTSTDGGGIKSRSLKCFAVEQPLKRRLYGGYELSAEETVDLAQMALSEHKSLHSYSPLSYSCEHFVTSMKLKIRWSEQVNSGQSTITKDVFQNIHRPISLKPEGVERRAPISAAFATMSLLNFCESLATPIVKGLSKAAIGTIVLAPVCVALDITSFVFEYKKENLSAEMCNKVLDALKDFEPRLQKHNEALKAQIELLTDRRHKAELFEQEVKRFDEKRLEEERKDHRCQFLEWEWLFRLLIFVLVFCISTTSWCLIELS